uniref:Uncharacterized protein n=1 Tax=Kalanchoe fedtschenkoi TaxID=63787 RepID=A0A7N0UDD2_KALFE
MGEDPADSAIPDGQFQPSGDHSPHQAITVWELNKARVASMQRKMSTPPSILSKTAGKASCSIFKVPQSLIDINGAKTYQPHIVSIGPYHHNKPHLQMIQEHKWTYLKSLVSRTQEALNLGLEDYLRAVHPLESKARDCYSELVGYGADEFVEMMVVDGCFVIELFRKVGGLVAIDEDDPLFTMSWIFSFFLRDLLRIENQLPYFILQSLFDLTNDDRQSNKSLSLLALEFFNASFQRPDDAIEKNSSLQGMHLLDLVRSSFISPNLLRYNKVSTPSHVIHCVSKLRKAGIELRARQAESFLDVKLRRGVIHMPRITVDDMMSSFLYNCVAFEQCQKNASNHFTTYATFLDYLVNTAQDVEFLSDYNIVENYFGTDGEVAKLVNNLGKDIAFDIDYCFLSGLFDDVHSYYKNSWHVQWASFKYTYFDTPWSFVSAFAAFILLVFTLVQTFFSAYSYFKPR